VALVYTLARILALRVVSMNLGAAIAPQTVNMRTVIMKAVFFIVCFPCSGHHQFQILTILAGRCAKRIPLRLQQVIQRGIGHIEGVGHSPVSEFALVTVHSLP